MKKSPLMIMYLGHQTPFAFAGAVWGGFILCTTVLICPRWPRWMLSILIYLFLSVAFLSMCCLGLMLVIALPFFLLHIVFNE
jgi:hypothetical protein